MAGLEGAGTTGSRGGSQKPRPGSAWRSRWPALFVGLGLALAALAYVQHARARQGFLIEKGAELRAIAELKVSQIVAWRAERLADARVVADDPLLVDAVRVWLGGGARAGAGAPIRAWLRVLRKEQSYERISLLDSEGHVRLTVPAQDPGAGATDELARKALEAADLSFLDLHRPTSEEGIHLELVAPLRGAADPAARPIAFLIFEHDPRRFLYPLIQSWPTPSRTGETLLIRREGAEVAYLNELRHRTDTALKLRLPVTRADLPAALVVSGREGEVEGVDYRGVSVLAAMRRVPDSPWFLVSKVDREEIVAPLAREARLTGLIAVLLIALSGLGAQRFRRREREASDAELYHRDERLRLQGSALAAAANAVMITDRAGNIVWVNDAFARLTGWSAEACQGKTPRILKSGEHPAELYGELWRTILAGDVWQREMVNRHRDGSTYVEDQTITPVRDERGEVTHFVAIKIDVTDRRQTEETLRENARELLESQRVARLGSYRLRVASGVWASSPILDEIFGIADPRFVKDVAGWLSIVHPDQREQMTAYFTEEVLGRRQSFDREYRITRLTDGQERWVHGLGRLVADSEGRIVEMIGTIQDVTEQKRLEAQFRQAQKMEAIGQLAGGVAHDFNNLLAVIVGYSELALRELPAEHPQRKRIEEIRKAGERAAGLTRQLLAFGRRQPMTPVVLGLAHVVSGLEGMLRRLLPEDIEIATSFDGGGARVRADPGQMEQVILNLAVNARDAMPDGGRLTIEGSSAVLDERYCRSHDVRPGRYALLAVTDTGTGMDAETQAHMFEPFFTTKEVGRGTGLGLATVYGIVKQHDGHVAVYSELGRGTTFKVYLPQVDAPARGEAVASTPKARGGSETVLLVEDDPPVRELSREVLDHLGYRVLVAPDGEAALETSARHQGPLHLLVTDMIMPRMTGRQLAEALRRSRPGIKVLFVSGYSNDVVVRSGALEEGMAFLQKPFTPDSLGRRIREVLGPS